MSQSTNSKNHHKIVLVGTGAVGSTFAYACTLLGIGQEMVIVDVARDRAEGNALDLTDALKFTAPKNIYAGDYKDAANADIVVITAGAAQKPGESRIDLISRNLQITKSIVTQVMESGFNGIFLLASNPVDILTYLTWKLSGFPVERVIGSGTSLDTSRLCKQVAALLKVSPQSVNGYMLGEHGDSGFAAWSHVCAGGKTIAEWMQADSSITQAKLDDIQSEVVNAAYEIIRLKGATYYGIGTALAQHCKAILNDEGTVLPVSTHINGQYGIKDIYIGTPAVLDRQGIRQVIEIPLNAKEQTLMAASAEKLQEIMRTSFPSIGLKY